MADPLTDWSVRGVLDRLTTRSPAEVVQTFYQRWGDSTTTTAGELHAAVHDVAANASVLLGGRMAGRPVICLFVDNRPDLSSVVLGLLVANCVVVPVNPNSHPSDVRFIVGNSQADAVVADDRSEKAFAACEVGVPVLRIESLLCPPSGPLASLPDVDPDSPAMVMHTSGTTSKPKGVVLTQRGLLGNSFLMAEACGLDRCTQLTTLPMYHVHALTFGVLSSLITAGSLVVLRSFEPLLWTRAMKAERVEWTSVVPSLLPLLAATGLVRAAYPDLRGIIVSSAPIIEELAAQIERSSGVPLLQAWGQTEFTCWATTCRFGCHGDEYDGKLRSVGAALPGVTVTIVDEAGGELGEGEEGEMVLKGPYVMRGYLNDPELTRRTISAEGLRTGDVGYYRTIRGEQHYFVSGRIRDVINRSGEKISPSSIEEEIFRIMPSAAGYVAVVGFHHEYLGEEVGLYVHDRLFADTALSREEFVATISAMHDAFRPRALYVSDEPVSTTFSGKAQRPKMKDCFAGASDFLGELRILAGSSLPPTPSSH